MKLWKILVAALLLAACQTQNPSAAREAARALLDEGVSAYQAQDYAAALPLFEQASQQGHMKAPRYLGLMYLNGYGVAKDDKRAFVEFSRAAEKGDITGQYWLAYCYENGTGTAKDMDKAVYWYQKSAERGDKVAAPAMTALGRLFENRDSAQAVMWYEKAAAFDEQAKQALTRLRGNGGV